jgi:hypothetical protein
MSAQNENWTLEKCKDSAAKHMTRAEWKASDTRAYNSAHRNDWLDECCMHMEAVRESWTLERYITSATNYSTRNAWRVGAPNAYNAARRNEWLDACCEHMRHI